MIDELLSDDDRWLSRSLRRFVLGGGGRLRLEFEG